VQRGKEGERERERRTYGQTTVLVRGVTLICVGLLVGHSHRRYPCAVIDGGIALLLCITYAQRLTNLPHA